MKSTSTRFTKISHARGWGSWGFFSKKRQIFVRQISIHRGKFSRDFAKSGKPPPSPRAISLVRLRRGQAICRLAQLARFLIRNGAGRGERARISGRFAELTLRGCRLSPNRRSLLFGLACSVLCMALSLLSRGTGSYGVHSDLLTDRSLGRQIFEDFRALRAQANFHSNFGKSPAAPRGKRTFHVRLYGSRYSIRLAFYGSLRSS